VSSRGPGRPPVRRHDGPPGTGRAPDLPWVLLVIAAALIGGLAAAELVHASLAIAVPVSAVLGGIAAFAAARWPARQGPGQGPGQRADQGPGQRAGLRAPEPSPAEPANRTRLAETQPVEPRPRHASDGTVVQLLPASAEAPWWDAAQGGPPAPSPRAKRVPAPDLSSYLASTIIAQCPNCGAFQLDFRRARARNGWDFRCESCGYTWTWQVGTPWPSVRVAPGRRHE
jgi:hypothetical protein